MNQSLFRVIASKTKDERGNLDESIYAKSRQILRIKFWLDIYLKWGYYYT